MESEAIQDEARHDNDRDRVANVGVEEEEVSSIDDTGDAPAENPIVDDV